MVGKPASIRLASEAGEQGLKADGHSLDSIKVEALDGNGDLVSDAHLAINVDLEGLAELAALQLSGRFSLALWFLSIFSDILH